MFVLIHSVQGGWSRHSHTQPEAHSPCAQRPKRPGTMTLMNGNVIDGKAVAQAIKDETAAKINELQERHGKVCLQPRS